MGLNSGKRMVRAGIRLAFLNSEESEGRDTEPIAAGKEEGRKREPLWAEHREN